VPVVLRGVDKGLGETDLLIRETVHSCAV